MEVTLRRSAGIRSALLGTLLVLGGCTTLPDVLPHAPEDVHELPPPEEVWPGRVRPASRPVSVVLENGMSVVLLEDHALPEVVVDTWFALGERDEGQGQRGFASLVEPLLGELPLDLAPELEHGGGAVHVSVDRDRTRSIGTGPAALLPLLLELEARRIAALHAPLAPARLARAREATRPTRAPLRPYARGEALLGAALYPPEHPYRHSLDLDEPEDGRVDRDDATPEAVTAFLRAHFGAENASLVVAGDFEPAEVRAGIERTFGALPRGSATPRAWRERASAAPLVLDGERRVVLHEAIEFPKLILAWPSPPGLTPRDAELDLLAILLAEGPESRLERRLVLDARLAQEVDAGQRPGELGSVFVIEALGVPGADLEALEREILAVVDELARAGPSRAELTRARARQAARFRRRMEGLLARAEAIQAHRRAFGVADGFRLDLERWTEATREDLRAAALGVLGPGRVSVRILERADAKP